MAEQRATVVAEFEGGAKVASEAKKVSNALAQAEKDSRETAKKAGQATKETGGLGDLAILLGGWGTPGPGDLDASGSVGPEDLASLLGAWTS